MTRNIIVFSDPLAVHNKLHGAGLPTYWFCHYYNGELTLPLVR